MGRSVSPRELIELFGKEKARSPRMVLPKEQKEPLVRARWNFPGRLVSPRERKEQVVSPGRIVSPRETLRPRMMMSLGIGCSIVGRKEWGFPG